ncbi:MAG: hypothetical protein J1F60_00985 [Oscillospiraceae bacterium]|nr:hypothetical protein [Oscillospiraceae bacterium]
MSFEELLNISPYSLEKAEKERLLTERLAELTEHHRKNCPEYARILNAVSYDGQKVSSYRDIPFLPVRLFKELSLKSVSEDGIVKTMTSSGTSGQKVSKIYLDRTTSSNQQKAMVKIVNDFTGSARMPMIILDCPSVVKDRNMFSARGAGILGFSIFGAKKIYALNDDMQLDRSGLQAFLEQNKGQRILLFGFTFMVWQYFYKELLRLKGEGMSFDLSHGILIHGGGWKKLAGEAVSPEEFRRALKDVCGLEHIHDYYGMVEQTGCIYMECEQGHLHASVFSDVIARRPEDFSECEIGERGILQVVSTIPESYPGHCLLTEDEGVILGEDDCPCGRKGKYFRILGRLKNAELRGCSDTFAAERAVNKGDTEASASDKITYLIGNRETLLNIPKAAPKMPFGDDIIDFLNDLSKELMQSAEAKAFPDVATLGFWLRKSSVLAMKKRFVPDGELRVGRGAAFHVAPSNVPVNYAYSLFAGLLCGNANAVRVTSREFPQVRIINGAICAALEKHPDMKPYIVLLRYERDREINDMLSAMCDVRVIWGGDDTVAELRKSPLPPRATEITFADRYSLAVIDSDEYMRAVSDDGKAAARIAADFYNDTYLSDQNACSSPRAVVWTGGAKEEAKEIFWDSLSAPVKERYLFQPIQGVDKLATEYTAAACGICGMKCVHGGDNRLVRVQVSELPHELMEHRGNSGYFYEYDCDDIMAVRDFCNDTHCQTIGLLGDKAIVEPLLRSGIKGVDRVVPIGHTMDFDLVWDGYDLVERFTRTVKV